MNHESLLMSVAATAISQRHAGRMPLKAEQYSQIAAVYEKAAADESLPAHTRAAFAKKADWFHLLSSVGEKRERATRIGSEAERKAPESSPDPFWFWGQLERDSGTLWGSLQRARRYASEVINGAV
jgi:hypothetical protein